MTNPFESAPAVLRHEHRPQALNGASHSQSDTKLDRNLDSTPRLPAPAYRRRLPPPPGPPSTPLNRKRGWQASEDNPSPATVIIPRTTGGFGTTLKFRDMSDTRDEALDANGGDVVLDLPPSKRRKGITGSFISTAYSAALVGAAVGLTVFRLWRDRGKEIEQSPPPPYQEEWSQSRQTAAPQEAEAPQPGPSHTQRGRSAAPSHKRLGGSVRHRQKVARKVLHLKKDRDASPKKPSIEVSQEDGYYQYPGSVTAQVEAEAEEEPADEMDWIGDKLAQLIEEGKRALGKEIVVSSEAPEDEVDDGSGNWVEEEEPEISASFSYPSRSSLSLSPSKRSRYASAGAYSVPTSASPRRSTFALHRDPRFVSDDLSATASSATAGLGFSTPAPFTMQSNESSSSFVSATYDSESPSIRESMERARAAYRRKRGLA